VVPLAVRKPNPEKVVDGGDKLSGSSLQVSIEYASSAPPNSQFIASLVVVVRVTPCPLGLLEVIVQFGHTPLLLQFVPVMSPVTVVPGLVARYVLCHVVPAAQQFHFQVVVSPV